MPALKVLLDSCIWSGAKQELANSGHDVKWVGDFLADPRDEAILELAFAEDRILITLDKDLANWQYLEGNPIAELYAL